MTGSGCYFSKLVGLTCCCSCSFAFEQRNTLFIPTLTLLLSYFLFFRSGQDRQILLFTGELLLTFLIPVHITSGDLLTSQRLPEQASRLQTMWVSMCACICISVHVFLSLITTNTFHSGVGKMHVSGPLVSSSRSGDQISRRARSQLISGVETSTLFNSKIPGFNAPTGAEVILAVTQPGSSPKVITLGWHLL